MTRELTDGAEHGDTSRMTNIVTSGASFLGATATPRTGVYAYAITLNNGTPSFQLPFKAAASEFYVRWGFRGTNNIAEWAIQLMNGGAQSGGVQISGFSSSVTLSGYDGPSTLRVTSIPVVWNTGEYHVIEIYVKHAASPNGAITIKFDGTPVAIFTGAFNSQSQTTALRCLMSGSVVHTLYWDDFAVNSASGGADNSWVGDGGVLAAIVPNGAGNYIDLIADSGTPYQRIDEIPSNGDTDYVYESTMDKKSTYAMSSMASIPTGASVSRVWVELTARKTVAVDDKIATLLRSGSTDDQGADQPLSTAYQRFLSAEYLTDPADSAAWTETKVNALEAGAVVR